MDINTATQQRLQLLAAGWSITRNRDKRTFMVGWPSAEVDEGVITHWSRKFKRDLATGIKLSDKLAVVDFDIDDAGAMAAIFDAVLDAVPLLDDADVPLLRRTGSGFKQAWFVRTEETFGRLHSRGWTRPGENADDHVVHRVEVFGGGSARQFGAFGPHTVTDDGVVLKSYDWLDRSPLDTRLDALPVLTKKQFFAIVDTVERTLERRGWSPVVRSTAGENDVSRVFDLKDGMMFDCSDGVTRSLQELRDSALANEGLRCSASWLEGPSARNRTRCLVGVDREGTLSIWESASGVTHMEAGETGKVDMEAFGARLRALAERQASSGPAAAPTQPAASPAPGRPAAADELSMQDSAAKTTAKLLRTYAYCGNAAFPEVLRIVTGKAGDGVDFARFQRLMVPYNKTVQDNGRQVTLKPAAMWLASSDRKSVEGSVLRPDMPAPLFMEGGRQWINTYYRPVHDATPEGEEEFLAFMEHLVPDAEERDYVMKMDAYKWLHPEVPGVAVLMVAEDQGAGRGTYFSMLHGVYGALAVKLDSATMASGSGQGQYNDYLAGSLIATCDEVLVASAASDKHRRYAYEQFKKNFETGPMMRRIIQKGRQNYDTMVYTSMRLATNHDDAMPIERDDRRQAIIRNGRPLVEAPAVKAGIDRYRPMGTFTPGFLSMLVRKWEAIDLTGFRSDGPVPAFEGRAAMIEANRTETDDMVEDLVEKVGDFISLRQLRDTYPQVPLTEIKQALKRLRWVKTEPGRSVYGDERKRAHVYARTAAKAALWQTSALVVRKEMLSKVKSPAELVAGRMAERGMSVIDGDKNNGDEK